MGRYHELTPLGVCKATRCAHAERWHGIGSKPRGQPSTIAPPSTTLIRHRYGRHTRFVLQNEEENQAQANGEQTQTGHNRGRRAWGENRLDRFTSSAGASCCSGRRSRSRHGRTASLFNGSRKERDRHRWRGIRPEAFVSALRR